MNLDSEKSGIQQKKPAGSGYLSFIIVSLAGLFYCYEYLLRISPSVMVQQLMSYYGITATGIGLLSATYYYAYTPLQLFVGLFTDYLGAKKVLSMAILSCAVGCILFAATHFLFVAFMGRFFIGFGSAFAYVGALTLANSLLSKKYFSYYAGIITSLGMLGALIGNFEMVQLVLHSGWRSMMLVGAVIGFILLILFIFIVKEPTSHDKVEEDILKKLLRQWCKIIINRHVWIIGIIGSLLYLSLSVFAEMWGPPFVHSIEHVSMESGAHISSMVFLGWLVGSPIQAWFHSYVKSFKKVFIINSFLACIIVSYVVLFPIQYATVMECMLFLFGLFCSCEILCFATIPYLVDKKSIATGIAFINFIIMLAGMLLQPLVGYLLDLYWQGNVLNHIRVYSAADFQRAMVILPVAMVVVMLLAMFLPKNIKTCKI